MPLSIHGCDVAPAKGADIFDGSELRHYSVNDLVDYAAERSSSRLLSWDSPLTGPSDPDGRTLIDGDLTQRPIEQFFSQKGPYKVPEGISVRPYSGCPHWTISQRVLGLPRIGPYSCSSNQLPFQPLCEQSDLEYAVDGHGRFVVEVHPAVALWLWCRETHTEGWVYKGKKCSANVEALWNVVGQCVPCARDLPKPKNDDQLDALVAWLLAERWVARDGVVLLGNAKVGSFLLPHIPAMEEAFSTFLSKRKRNGKR
jgi:uncharacterized protein DUF429